MPPPRPLSPRTGTNARGALPIRQAEQGPRHPAGQVPRQVQLRVPSSSCPTDPLLPHHRLLPPPPAHLIVKQVVPSRNQSALLLDLRPQTLHIHGEGQRQSRPETASLSSCPAPAATEAPRESSWHRAPAPEGSLRASPALTQSRKPLQGKEGAPAVLTEATRPAVCQPPSPLRAGSPIAPLARTWPGIFCQGGQDSSQETD